MSSITKSVSTIGNNNESIDGLQSQIEEYRQQICEFQDLRQSIVKVTGKNCVRKVKPQLLTASDRINVTEISHWL
jgi:hypothetical protein